MNPSLKNEVFAVRGEPDHIRSDNGPEFAIKAVKRWLAISGVKTLFIAPGARLINTMRFCLLLMILV